MHGGLEQWDRGLHTSSDDFFETSALLITFISCGAPDGRLLQMSLVWTAGGQASAC